MFGRRSRASVCGTSSLVLPYSKSTGSVMVQETEHKMSTNRLLTLYMEEVVSRVNFAKRRAALDMREGIIGAIMALNIAESKDH